MLSFIQGRYAMCTEFRDLVEGTRTALHVVHNQQSAQNDGDIDNRTWYRFVSRATGTPVQVWSMLQFCPVRGGRVGWELRQGEA